MSDFNNSGSFHTWSQPTHTPSYDSGPSYQPPPSYDPGPSYQPPSYDPSPGSPPLSDPSFDPTLSYPGFFIPLPDPSPGSPPLPSFDLLSAPATLNQDNPNVPSFTSELGRDLFEASLGKSMDLSQSVGVIVSERPGQCMEGTTLPPTWTDQNGEKHPYHWLSPDGSIFSYEKQTTTCEGGQMVITTYEPRPDGSVIVHQQLESELFAKDHTQLWPAPPHETPEHSRQSTMAQELGGFVVGAGLSQLPGGALIGSVAHSTSLVDTPTKSFQTGYEVGSIAAGLYQTYTGATMVAEGGSGVVGGALGAPVSGGASVAVSALSLSTATIGALIIAQGAANISVGIRALANAQITNSGGPRPNSVQTEKFAQGGNAVPVRGQPTYKGGKMAKWGTAGSTRPDFELPEASVVVEAKNYDLSKGNAKLIANVVPQALKRAAELPPGTKQALVIDVRGQAISHDQLNQLFQQINAKTGNLFENRWWVFMN